MIFLKILFDHKCATETENFLGNKNLYLIALPLYNELFLLSPDRIVKQTNKAYSFFYN